MMTMYRVLPAHSLFADARGLTPLSDTPASTPSMLPINATIGERTAHSSPSTIATVLYRQLYQQRLQHSIASAEQLGQGESGGRVS